MKRVKYIIERQRKSGKNSGSWKATWWTDPDGKQRPMGVARKKAEAILIEACEAFPKENYRIAELKP